MKKYFFELIIIMILLVSTFFTGCKEDPVESLYNPNYISGPAPTITNIETIYPVYDVGRAFAGIGVVRITGTNFLNDVNLNFVYFDNLPGTVLSASETELQVKTPNVLGDSVKIKIATNVDSFSTDYYYQLIAAVEEVYSFKVSEEPKSITCDANGDLFFTMYLNAALSDSVWHLTPEGVLSGYGNPIKEYDAMKMGPNGDLFAVHGTRKRFYTFPSGGGTQALWLSTGEKMNDFDFDANLNIWAAGPATDDICRIRTTDKDIKKFTYLKEVQALRVYNGDLYLAAKTDSTMQIVTLPIVNDDSLGTVESEYLDLTSLADYDVAGITFDVKGNMYVAVTSPEGIIVSPAGGGTYEALYPDVINPNRKSISLFWGMQNETNLFLSRTAKYDTSGTALVNPGIIKINTLNFGAPNYGRGDL